MARQKTETVTRTRPAPRSKPKPWWDGLSRETARELERRGYHSKEDAMLFVTERPRFANKRRRQTVYDPLHFDRPWLNNGNPLRVSREMYNEIRVWLGAKPLA